jgi:UDP-N-acetylmuramoyl-L-alanyl-D-glutamate--2,6-diaminopimelate ligase
MDLARVFPSPVSEINITNLAYSTAQVTPGSLFFCVRGFTRDGHEFAQEAIQKGAVALVVDHPLNLGVPEVVVDNVRKAMAPAAANFYGDPTNDLQILGVTGTNGKTTTAFLMRDLLEQDNRQTGLLGTVKSIIGGDSHEVVRTTPEAIDLQRTFREMADKNDVAAVMEVSSHALELHRADAIHFAAAIFTNLTQDHLDFHPTMEDYFQAKRKLFTHLKPQHSIINIDDAYGARLAQELSSEGDGHGDGVITFALDNPEATYRATNIDMTLTGSSFTAQTPDGEVNLTSPLRGRFNVYNVLGAFAAARALHVPHETAARAIESAGRVPGRFEAVDEGQDFAVIVDYAHTPDSLQNVLNAARGLTDKRVIVVFGAGGDRDRTKRPMMGEIASRLADETIVTSDNPRSEDPDTIIEEILKGSKPDTPHNADRKAAIAQAIEHARAGDVVVIAGKGHEQGQEFENGRKIPFDDVTVARDALRSAAIQA